MSDGRKKIIQSFAYLNWCGRGNPRNDAWTDWFKAESLYETNYVPLDAPDAWLNSAPQDFEWEKQNTDIIVRTINVFGPGPGNCLGERVTKISRLIHRVYPSKVGLIGVQELFHTDSCDGANHFARELQKVYRKEVKWDYTHGTNAILHSNEWERISREYKELDNRFSSRYALENVLRHRQIGWTLRFYTAHISWKKGKTHDQIRDLAAWVKKRAQPGELPPIVTGDFNDGGRNLKGGEPGDGVLEMEKYFWRPMDLAWTEKRVEGLSHTGIDVIYIGKKSAFPHSRCSYQPIATHNLWFATKFKDTDSHPRIAELYLTDHPSRAITLKISKKEYLNQP